MAMNQQARRVIRVVPVITADAYADNDVLFNNTEIPLAVGKKGECSKLVSAMIISKSTQVFDGELFFCQTTQSVGAANSARNISDADFAAAKVLGRLTLDGSADDYTYGGGKVFNFDINLEGAGATDGDVVSKQRFPILLQAASGTTSVFCFMLLSGTDVTPNMSVGDLELVLGVEY